MKVWRKFTAVALALVMMLAMSVSALAAQPKTDGTRNASNGINANDTETPSNNNTINIAKEIIFVNSEATDVREPNITYTYTISPVTEAQLTPSGGSAKATVTGPLDSDSNTSMATTVKAGVAVANAVSSGATSTVSFADTNAKIAATSAGASDRKYASFTFVPSAFVTTGAGIYRYLITESVETDARTHAGITSAATYVSTRYLDVYLKWTSETHEELAIYGYVLFEGNSSDSLDASTTKSAGYVNTGTSTQADVDVYTTHNLVITGKTTGGLADKANNFPVTITFTKASGLTDSIKLDFAVTNGGALTKKGTDDNSDYVTMDDALSGTLHDTSTITITGVPANSTVTMTEGNNTVDSYRVKAGVEADGATLLAENTVAANGTSGATTSQQFTTKVLIYITNTLDAISPTGVTLRFAPYFAMLGAGIVALPLTIRRKVEDF